MGRKIVSGSHGKHGRLYIGANEFCAEDWDIQEVKDEEDTTNTCSAGAAEQEMGVGRLEGTINYTWDAQANPYVAPPNLSVGSKHASSKLYIHSAPGVDGPDGPYFGLTLHVISHQTSTPVRGKLAGTITFASHGSYTLPTGNVSSSGA